MVDTTITEKLSKLATIDRKLEKLSAIMKVHLRVGTVLDLEKISRICLRELINVVSCNRYAVILLNDNGVNIVTKRAFSKIFREMKLGNNSPIVRHILDTKQPIFSGSILNSPTTNYILNVSSINSLIAVPILVNDEVKGIIYLDSPEENAFDEEDFKFTNMLSKEISMAFNQTFRYSHSEPVSARDILTGCFTRAKFDSDIASQISSAKKNGEQLSLLMVDIDWFKKYTDFHGSNQGDRLLAGVSNTLASYIRAEHKVYRYDTDRFAILLIDTNKIKSSLAAMRIWKTIEQTQFEGEQESQPEREITVSIGVATFPLDAIEADELTVAANSALQKAKDRGRNQVCVVGREE